MGASILAERSRLARHHARMLEKAREAALKSTAQANQAMEVSPRPPALDLRDLCRRTIKDLRQVEVAAHRLATAERLLAEARGGLPAASRKRAS